MVRKNGNVRKTNKKLKKERTNNMKTPKLTQTRHFKKIAASAIAITMIGTILVMPASNRTENELLGGTSFSASADTVESGSCGEDATWTLDANGKPDTTQEKTWQQVENIAPETQYIYYTDSDNTEAA